MNRDKLNEAMESISDRHLQEADAPKAKRPVWIAAAAAVLALVILAANLLPGGSVIPSETAGPGLSAEDIMNMMTQPAPPSDISAEISGELPGGVKLLGLLAQPEYPEMQAYPEDSFDYDTYELWRKSQKAQYGQPEGYADSLTDFWAQSLPLLLSGEEENSVCSPVNIYMALAMLAECTDGNSRQQILELLDADSIKSLREQAGHVWNAHFCYDGLTTSILGSSLWLDDSYVYDKSTVSTLANSYYASVFRGQLGSSEMNTALQEWLNDQTGGMLREQAQNVKLEENTALALATTIFYRASWSGQFSESRSTTEVFHAPSGDISWAFMHKTITQGTYYDGKDFGAVVLSLEDGSRMWLVLPDKGKTPQDILDSGHAVDMILGSSETKRQRAKINLSMPRFDVCAETDLVPSLKKMGITDVFSEAAADFTAIMPESQGPEYRVYLGKADHAARVAVDEEGVAAAAYTVMHMYATGAPDEPDLEIDFVLDRPFLFVVESRDGLPTFAGVVNQP